MGRRAQIWVAVLVLTFAAIMIVIALWVFAIGAWRETLGAGAYVIVFVVALVLSIGIGRVVRWLTNG